MADRILITGITGQDGSYLAEHLLRDGKEVHGLYRRTSTGNLRNIDGFRHLLVLHQGDLGDPLSVHRVIDKVRPTHVFNMADQDHVGWSFDVSAYNSDITAGAVGRLLESVRLIDKDIKVFQPVSATVFGNAQSPQDESTPLKPLSPYACAKAHAWHLARMYREVYGMFVSTGVFYNHDSPRRHGDYLLHKVARQACKVKAGFMDNFEVNGPDVELDVGCANEYTEAAIAILNHSEPDDFVVATGRGVSLLSLMKRILTRLDVRKEPVLLGSTPDYSRPGPIHDLIGDPSKIRAVLGWGSVRDARDVLDDLLVKYWDHDGHDEESRWDKTVLRSFRTWTKENAE